MLRRYDLNFYEYEMLIERELCLFFTAFLKTVNNLLRISYPSYRRALITILPTDLPPDPKRRNYFNLS